MELFILFDKNKYGMQEECEEILKLQMKVIDGYGLNEFKKFIISPMMHEHYGHYEDGALDSKFPKKFCLNIGIRKIFKLFAFLFNELI